MRRRTLVIGVAALVGAGVGGAFGLRAAARRVAEARLTAALEARGFEGEWGPVSVGWDGTVRVARVSVRSAALRAHHTVDIEAHDLAVPVGWRDGGPAPLGGHMRSLRVAVNALSGPVPGVTDTPPVTGAVGGGLLGLRWTTDRLFVGYLDGAHGRAATFKGGGAVWDDGLTVTGDLFARQGGYHLTGRGELAVRRAPEGWGVALTADDDRWGLSVEAVDPLDPPPADQRGASAEVERLTWDARAGVAAAGLSAQWGEWAMTAEGARRGADGRLHLTGATVTVPGGPEVVIAAATLDPDGPVTARGSVQGGGFDVALDTWPHPTAVAAELDRLPLDGAWAGRPAVSGRLSGALWLVADGPLHPARPLTALADLALSAGRVDHPLVAAEALTGLAGQAQVDLAFAPGDVQVPAATLRLGAVTAHLRAGFVDDVAGGTLTLDAQVAPVACQAAVDAIPAAVLGPWQGLTAEGTWQPTAKATVPLGRPDDVAVTIRGVTKRCTFTGLAGTRAADPDVRVGDGPADLSDVTWLNQPFRFRVRTGVDADVERWVGPGTGGWVPGEQLPRYVGGAAYLTEEMNFWHGGAISPGLMARAVATNLAAGRYVYGGSTVTQQLVKNLFFSRDKTLLRKVREALVAARVTDAVPKARILALYLNCIEFGPNVFGVGAAARYYFGKHPSALTVREAIFLAMLKPAPRRGGGYKARGSEPDFPWWRGRVVQVADRLLEAGLISAAQRDAALAQGPLRWVGGVYQPAGGPAAPGASPAPPPDRPLTP